MSTPTELPRWADIAKLTLYGILENFGYRQLNIVWRIEGIWQFFRKQKGWGEMTRKGFGAKPAAAKPMPVPAAAVTSTVFPSRMR